MTQKSVKQQIKGNSMWQMSFSLVSKIGALAFTVILARFLLPETYGLYNLAFSIAVVLFAFTDLGINTTLVRFVSKAVAEKNLEKAAAYFRYLASIKLCLSALAALALLFLAYPLSKYIFNQEVLFWPLVLLAVYFFIVDVASLFVLAFYTTDAFRYAFIKEVVSQAARFGLALIVFITFASSLYLRGVFAALIAAEVIVLFVVFLLAQKSARFIFMKSRAVVDKRRVLTFLGYSSISLISMAFFGHMDTIMLGLFVDDARFIGYYASALNLVLSATALLLLTNALLPVFTSLKKNNLQRPFNILIRYTTILTVPAAFGLAVVGRYIIQLIYGSEFLPAQYPLYILAPLIVSGVATAIATTMFSAREKPKVIAKAILYSLALNVLLNAVLISVLANISFLWAINGAAIATLVSRYVYLAVLFVLLRKELKIQPRITEVVRPLFVSIVMAAAVFGVTIALGDITIVKGGIIILFGIVFYALLMYVVKGITKKDLQYIKSQ